MCSLRGQGQGRAASEVGQRGRGRAARARKGSEGEVGQRARQGSEWGRAARARQGSEVGQRETELAEAGRADLNVRGTLTLVGWAMGVLPV